MTKDQLDLLQEHLDVGKGRMELVQQDVDRCLQINGQSADGHCRKGQLLLQLSRPWDAKDAFRVAIELDKNNKEAAAGYQRCLTVLDQDVHQARVRISQQPGVRRCLQDQRMKEALKLMQEDPMQARR
ncbi:Stress-induced-phosphoprotein 1 [Amphibalanus amphitrite]|uniref:Stress-induced-phosphoprotein 1 n=1 Tax=Amphibalanus amphitrite TaxID=1232801 RepID=A0A6A4X465_AMPAM|nr:Stress-induced-phosphoprotein 1 [Amphibalanus amphitrite]